MKIKDLPRNCTFAYKNRRWYRGAYLPFLDQYEIFTTSGDRYTKVNPDEYIDSKTIKAIKL